MVAPQKRTVYCVVTIVQSNPYEAPRAPIPALPGTDGKRVEEIANGQKLVIYAILVNLATIGLQMVFGPLAALGGLLALVMAIIGIVRLGSGMAMSVASRIILVVLMFVPLVNLISLLVLNSRATTQLRNAGYKVGLLGASK